VTVTVATLLSRLPSLTLKVKLSRGVSDDAGVTLSGSDVGQLRRNVIAAAPQPVLGHCADRRVRRRRVFRNSPESARPRRGMREIAALDSALLANNRSGFRRVVFALQLYAITRIVNHLRPCLRSCDGGYTLRLTSLS
jgi:hypothetical protein